MKKGKYDDCLTEEEIRELLNLAKNATERALIALQLESGTL